VAYLALARKYRPQRFADMIGQEHVTRTLENAIKTDRVHHAYLFCGVRGLGKTTAARILAKCLVCEGGPTPEPCNQCSQCVGVNEGRSVDVVEIDGASNNSVEGIRALRDQVAYMPHSARRKIYIIDEVHMLTTQAFNALLKTLEEPPAHVTFMFATTDPHKVLPTILSRVSRLDYRRVRVATLAPYLRQILQTEGFAVEDEGLQVIARCGEGSVRDSLTLLDKVIAFAQEPTAITTAEVLTVLGQASRYAVAQLVQAILDRDALAVLTRFEDITATGSDLMQLALAILQHLRDLTVVKLTGSRAALLDMDDDLYEQLVAQAAAIDAELLAQHFDRFARAVDSLENSRVPRLVIEMGLLELVNAEPALPLGDLVARLDAFAGGRPGPAGGRSGGGRGGVPGDGRARRADAPAREPLRAAAGKAAPAASTSALAGSGSGSDSGSSSSSSHGPGPAEPEPGRGPSASKAPDSHIDMLEQLARDAGLLPGAIKQAEPKRTPKRAEPWYAADAPSLSADEARLEPRNGSHNGEPRNGSHNGERLAEPRSRSHNAEPRSAEPRSAEPRSAEPRPAEPRVAEPRVVEPPSVEPRRAEPADFHLTNEDLAPAAAPGDPDAGCPSSRCVPREAIPWRTLAAWDAWEAFLDRIRPEHDMLSAILAQAGLVSLREGVIEIALPAAGFGQGQLRDNPELRSDLERFTAEYFGDVMRLELIDATPSLPHAPSLELVEAERAARHRREVVADAEHNPRIRSLLRTFSGVLESIEPLGGPALPPVGQRGLPG
jgi:DNA polymerase III subunit gamma/tau